MRLCHVLSISNTLYFSQRLSPPDYQFSPSEDANGLRYRKGGFPQFSLPLLDFKFYFPRWDSRLTSIHTKWPLFYFGESSMETTSLGQPRSGCPERTLETPVRFISPRPLPSYLLIYSHNRSVALLAHLHQPHVRKSPNDGKRTVQRNRAAF